MMDRWGTAFAVGWAAQIVLCAWREWRWRRRHAADLRLLRHMAEGQADLQRQLQAYGVAPWGPAAVCASREVD